MRSKIIILSSLVFLLSIPSLSYPVETKKGKPYEAPETVPAKIEDVSYVTGLREIDVRKYTQSEQYSGWFELGESDVAFRRNRIDQKKGRGLEDVDIVRFKYPDIKELYFGYDAVFKAAKKKWGQAVIIYF